MMEGHLYLPFFTVLLVSIIVLGTRASPSVRTRQLSLFVNLGMLELSSRFQNFIEGKRMSMGSILCTSVMDMSFFVNLGMLELSYGFQTLQEYSFTSWVSFR